MFVKSLSLEDGLGEGDAGFSLSSLAGAPGKIDKNKIDKRKPNARRFGERPLRNNPMNCF
jgi:hypothetical protein